MSPFPPQNPSVRQNNSQLRLASVRVVEAVCLWRNDIDMQAERTNSAPSSGPPGRGKDATTNGDAEESARAPSQHQHLEDVGIGDAEGVDDPPSPRQPFGENDRSGDLDDRDEAAVFSDMPQARNNHGHKGSRSKAARKQTAKMAAAAGGVDVSILGKSNPVGGKSGGGRVAKGRWVATMMVPGRKLWDSSPAMMSQHKRFRRSRQNPKIARDQVCRRHLGKRTLQAVVGLSREGSTIVLPLQIGPVGGRET